MEEKAFSTEHQLKSQILVRKFSVQLLPLYRLVNLIIYFDNQIH